MPGCSDVEGRGTFPLSKRSQCKITEVDLQRGSVLRFRAYGDRCGSGYDHKTGATGLLPLLPGTGFFVLCTPVENTVAADMEDVRLGINRTRIAAHAGDIAKGVKRAMDWYMKIACPQEPEWKLQACLS
jgi:thiamine biosynthesis protein ThiC